MSNMACKAKIELNYYVYFHAESLTTYSQCQADTRTAAAAAWLYCVAFAWKFEKVILIYK